MALNHVFDVVQNATTGVPINGVTIQLFDQASGDLALIYRDALYTPFDPINTAVTADGGFYSYYVEDGTYTIRLSLGGVLLREIRDFVPNAGGEGSGGGPSGRYQLDPATEGQTEFVLPFVASVLPIVLQNGIDLPDGAVALTESNTIVLAEPAHLGDVITVAPVVPITVPAVELGNVIGLPAALAGKASTALATAFASGLMPAADKAKVDGIVPATTSLAGLMSAADKAKANKSIYLEDGGAVGNGVTDDSAALTACFALLPKGGTIRGTAGKSYFFADPPIIPEGIRLIGEWVPREDLTPFTQPSEAANSIIIPSSKTIRMRGSELAGWLIWRQGLVMPTSALDAVAKIAAYAGTAITGVDNDVVVHGNTIIGFEWAGKFNNVDRPEVYQNCGDCTNGFEASGVFDCGNRGISENRFWPYLTSHQVWSDWYLARRSGKAIYIHDNADGLRVMDNFDYGYTIGLHLHNVAFVRASHLSDNIGGHDVPNAVGTIGIYTTGEMNCVQIDQSHIDSHEKNYRFAHSGIVQLGSNTSGSATRFPIVLEPASNGELGNFVVRGSCETPILAATGVGLWRGLVYTDATATSSQAISFTAADRNNLRIEIEQPAGGSLTNALGVRRFFSASVFDTIGAGTPEGVIAASIGSTYRRTDGGAGTSFYVKESGTSTTGWVGK